MARSALKDWLYLHDQRNRLSYGDAASRSHPWDTPFSAAETLVEWASEHFEEIDKARRLRRQKSRVRLTLRAGEKSGKCVRVPPGFLAISHWVAKAIRCRHERDLLGIARKLAADASVKS
ncbi:hypothetical protein ACFWY5_53680 [Nonomuraea sp. NPDC059007]|uniref:hypothetical protein n=1 Tax=Nonomuraea sp. NPDC059007 TaxID=3346692 RepID=UPI0036C958AB